MSYFASSEHIWKIIYQLPSILILLINKKELAMLYN
nr:MAG TPA: hypothetical protein [Caudoviricetes sp.]